MHFPCRRLENEVQLFQEEFGFIMLLRMTRRRRVQKQNKRKQFIVMFPWLNTVELYILFYFWCLCLFLVGSIVAAVVFVVAVTLFVFG